MMMRSLFGKCRRFHKLRVSDDPGDTLFLKRHAQDCRACGAVLDSDRRIAAAAAAWRDESPVPPASLALRIEASLARESLRPSLPDTRSTQRGRLLSWIPLRPRFAAAVLLVIVAVTAVVVWRVPLPVTPETRLASAIRAADRSEQNYARAIADLEKAASSILARANDPAFNSESVAILVTYRDRLAHLDTVIAEVQGFLEDNPGHTGGHTILLAAYKEKAEVLRKVIALPDRGTS